MGFRKKRLPEEFHEWGRQYSLVRSDDEKINCLEEQLHHIPHGDEFNKVRSHISRRLRELKAKVTHKREQARKIKESRGVKFNEELPTIGLIGPPNSGKTNMVNGYCGTSYSSTSIPFETKNPKFGVVQFEDIKLQFIEVPSDLEPRYVQLLHKTDLILITGFEPQRFIDLILKYGINVKYVVLSKDGREYEFPALTKLWEWLELIRVYSKGDDFPTILRLGATVKEFLRSIHSSWIKRFKTALVTGPSAKFPNQNVTLNHVLADKDVIEVKLKKE